MRTKKNDIVVRVLGDLDNVEEDLDVDIFFNKKRFTERQVRETLALLVFAHRRED